VNVLEQTTCSICGYPLEEPTLSLPNLILQLPQHFWNYCEATVHWSCFARWEHRLTFSQPDFEHQVNKYKPNKPDIGYVLLQRDNWALLCGRKGPHTHGSELVASITRHMHGEYADMEAPLTAGLAFRDWVFKPYSRWYGWDKFVMQTYEWLPDLARAEIQDMMRELRYLVPDVQALDGLLNSLSST
jgi:hypothetical protein